MHRPIISVVTVVYNGVKNIEKTIHSVINQIYKEIDYIIIDGGSKDGTVEIIKRFDNHLSYWISEKDNGIYDAMNKGIMAAKGEWIIFINCGDFFYSHAVLQEIFVERSKDIDGADVIYGRSKMFFRNGAQKELLSGHDLNQHWKGPVFRQGAMFVKTAIHKRELFLTSDQFRISGDYELMYRLDKKGYIFKSIETIVLLFEKEGISDDGLKNIRDNYLIIKRHGEVNFSKWLYYKIKLIKEHIAQSKFYKRYKQIRRVSEDR